MHRLCTEPQQGAIGVDEHKKGLPRSCAVQQPWPQARTFNQKVTSHHPWPWDIKGKNGVLSPSPGLPQVPHTQAHNHPHTHSTAHLSLVPSMAYTLTVPCPPSCQKVAVLRLDWASLDSLLSAPERPLLIRNAHRHLGHRCQARGLPPASDV